MSPKQSKMEILYHSKTLILMSRNFVKIILYTNNSIGSFQKSKLLECAQMKIVNFVQQ